jgi:cyclophilin family peptidyl-prolyl cis-trans isomerase
VILSLAQGPVEIQLFEKDSPAHCQNFKRLVKSGFFNGTTFYRVCFGFIQGGDPTGTGKGGIEQTIAPEIKRPCLRGSIVAARRDDARNPARESHGSQFFILKQDQPSFTGRYTVFGQVVKGMEIVDRIPLGDKAQDYQVAAGAEKITKAELK